MAVVLQTWGEQLQDVQNAIKAVHQSQRYELNGRMMQKADLEWLHKERLYLSEMLQTQGDVIVGSVITRGSAQVSFS